MTLKSLPGWALKVVALTAIYFILVTICSIVVPTPNLPSVPSDKVPAVFLGIGLMSLVDTLVVALLISHARWRGWKLIGGLALAFYGVSTVMAQIETWYFSPALGIDPGIIPPLMLRNLIVTAFFIPLAVLLLGRMTRQPDDEPNGLLVMPAGQWIWKLGVIAVVYIGLYFLFGRIVAWQNPALRAMYGGGANAEVFSNARLVPLQLLRGVLWASFVLPVIRFTRARPLIAAVLLGLLIALPMNIGHAIPNPIMPDPSVRLSHFIETTTSNFLFGLLIYWLLRRRHQSLGDLLGQGGASASGQKPVVQAGD